MSGEAAVRCFCSSGRLRRADDDLWTDEDDEQFLAELEQERSAAAALVHETFPRLADDPPPQPDLDRATAALREGVATGGWPYRRSRRGTPTTRHVAASVQRTPEGAVVEVNSRERAAEVAALVRQADVSAELVEERESTQYAPAAPEPMEMTPEIEAALREHMENYEREWCDMSIPALDGRTPREAVRTAQGRAAVEDLLSDMPQTAAGMSAKRLRKLLELPTPLR